MAILLHLLGKARVKRDRLGNNEICLATAGERAIYQDSLHYISRRRASEAALKRVFGIVCCGRLSKANMKPVVAENRRLTIGSFFLTRCCRRSVENDGEMGRPIRDRAGQSVVC